MMPISLDLRGADGSVTGSVTLDEALFGIQPNVPVLHQVVTAQLAAARAGTQSTKTRAEVSGGGRKPFKQKGTGRARQGSERAPQFAGGGIALGPKPRSYRQRTPRKMIQLALRSALSDRASEHKVVVVRAWPWEAPSTKQARSFVDALELDGTVLVVLGDSDEEAYKSFRNLPAIQLLMASELNAYDILCNDWIVFTAETLPGETTIEETVVGKEAVVDAPLAEEPPAEASPDVAPSDDAVLDDIPPDEAPTAQAPEIEEPDAELPAVDEPPAEQPVGELTNEGDQESADE
jgi:large subunit ribosomal protein L4